MNRRGFLASLAALAAAPMVPHPIPAFSVGGIVRRPAMALIGHESIVPGAVYLDGAKVGRVYVRITAQTKAFQRSLAKATEAAQRFERDFKDTAALCQP